MAKNAEIVEKADSDPHLNDEGAIGWTGEGVVAKFADVDFKDGNTYQQIAVVSTHGGGTNPSGFLMLYIDDVNNEDNLVAKQEISFGQCMALWLRILLKRLAGNMIYM